MLSPASLLTAADFPALARLTRLQSMLRLRRIDLEELEGEIAEAEDLGRVWAAAGLIARADIVRGEIVALIAEIDGPDEDEEPAERRIAA